MALCGNSRGIWRSLSKVSVTIHPNRLVLEQWTKRWITISSSKLLKYYVCEIKKAFYYSTCKILCWKNRNLESIVVIRGKV